MMKKCPLKKFAEKNKQYAPVLLRLIIGLVFITHGFPKLFVQGPSGVAGFFGTLGIPLPLFFAWVVSLVEFFGGIALILGVMVRHTSLLMAIIMVVAILTTKLGGGFSGMRYDLVLLVANLSLVLSGAGPISIEEKFCKDK